MIVNNIKLSLVLFVLLIIQFITNNVSSYYVDLIGMLLIFLTLYGSYNFLYIIGISLVAELFGYWYIGEHLIAIVILSFIATKISRLFSICNWIQKLIVIESFFCVMSLIIFAINKIFNAHSDYLLSFLIQIFIFIPILQIIYEKFILTKRSDILWYD